MHVALNSSCDCHMTWTKKMDLVFMSVFVALCYWQLCMTLRNKKQAKERVLDSNSLLQVDGFDPHYLVKLILKCQHPQILNNNFVSAKSQPAATNCMCFAIDTSIYTWFSKPTLHANARAHFYHVTKAGPSNFPF